MKQNFFDEIDGDWEDVISDVYEKSNSTVLNYDIYDGEKIISEYAYYDEENKLSGSIIIPDGVTAILESAFTENYEITNVIFPDTLKSIDRNAFRDCTGLTGDLILPNSIEFIGSNAFMDCGFDGKLILPNKIEIIYPRVFAGCKFTGELVIPNNDNLVIHKLAFYECNFSNIKIGKNVKLESDWDRGIDKSITKIEFY